MNSNLMELEFTQDLTILGKTIPNNNMTKRSGNGSPPTECAMRHVCIFTSKAHLFCLGIYKVKRELQQEEQHFIVYRNGISVRDGFIQPLLGIHQAPYFHILGYSDEL